MKLNWVSLQVDLNCLYSVCMYIVYLKNEGNCLVWLIPVWSLFKWAFYDASSCHFAARWHSRQCVKYDVPFFSTRCKTIIHSLINLAFLAGWSGLQRVLSRVSVSLAEDCFMSLLQLLQSLSLQAPDTADHRHFKKESKYVPKTPSFTSLCCLCPVALNHAQYTPISAAFQQSSTFFLPPPDNSLLQQSD